jgi:hypothetical protein
MTWHVGDRFESDNPVQQGEFLRAALRRGEHVHRHVGDDVLCEGNDSECPVFDMQLKEAMHVWAG